MKKCNVRKIEMYRKIKHQKQTCDESCMSACIAMILGKTTDEVKKEFHDDYLQDKITTAQYLMQNGVYAIPRLTGDRKLFTGSIYILAVPGLGSPGLLHAIVFDTRDELTVYDPMRGVGGGAYYSCDGADDGSIKMRGLSVEAEVRCFDEELM